MIDFLILYENKNREKEGVFLVKQELENRGYSVEFAQIHYQKERLKSAKVMIVPFLYNNEDIYHYVYLLNGKKQKVIDFRWEQIFSNQNEGNPQYFSYPQNEAKKVIHLCWGEAIRNKLIEFGVSPDKAILAGPVHLDMINWNEMYYPKQKMGQIYGLNHEKKWILFVSSFSWTTLSDEQMESLKERLGNYTTEFTSIAKKSKQRILEWLSTFAAAHKDYEVLYRLHPSERYDEELTRLHHSIENFHLNSEDTVAQWIKVCDKTYNWFSTSAIQSYLLNKGNVVLRPYKIPHQYDISIFENAYKISSYEKFCEDIFSHSENKKDLSFEKYYDTSNGYAYQKICDICETVINENYSENIDYDKILSFIPFKNKVKSFFYPIYVKFMYKLSSYKLTDHFPFFSNTRKKAFTMAVRNTFTDEEINEMDRRVKNFICFNQRE